MSERFAGEIMRAPTPQYVRIAAPLDDTEQPLLKLYRYDIRDRHDWTRL